MRARLIKFLNDVRASYWFIPLCMMLSAMLLALLISWVDEGVSLEWLPWNIAASTDDARSILSVIATSVLGVAGVTFSITIVAVSFASANFGPRLINNFMSDRGSQYTLGTFIATFVYCLTVLTNVHGSTNIESGGTTDAFVPHLSIAVALLLTFASITVLIYFIHHITETINIENIIADIGSSLVSGMADLRTAPDELRSELSESFDTMVKGKLLREVPAGCIGYVQTIDLERLASIAEEENLLIRVHYRPGDFTSTHDCLLSVWTSTLEQFPEQSLRECFATGQERTVHQNVLFLVEQLGEVIARALSPGINDPFTAISCMNWFRTALMEYLARAAERGSQHGEQDVAEEYSRVQLTPITLSRLCQVMFDQTRQYVSADRNVTLHVMALLCECAWFAGEGPARTLFMEHLDKLYKSSTRQLSDAGEDAAVGERYAQALDVIAAESDKDRIRAQADWFGGSA
ncbi:MAG: DUF2254 domain-containing protein [Granulosicoccus sp.]|nr:DUF2254 domain-containing protein [Granulosicoccus sp.]